MKRSEADQVLGSGRLESQVEMFDLRWRCKEGADDRTPLGEQVRFTKTDGVVFQRVPENLQHIAFGIFNAVVDLGTAKALGLAGDRAQTMLDGFLKCGLLAWLDADVCDFEDHGGLEKLFVKN